MPVDTRCRHIAINNTCHHVRRGAAGGIDLWYSVADGLLAGLAMEAVRRTVLRNYRSVQDLNFVDIAWVFIMRLGFRGAITCTVACGSLAKIDFVFETNWYGRFGEETYSPSTIVNLAFFSLLRGCSVQQGR